MAAMYELSRTPTPGMFLRNRSNAVSVRARRRKVLDQNGNDVETTENTMPKTPNQSVSAFAKKEVGYYSSSDKKRKEYSLGGRKFRFDFWTLLILSNSFSLFSQHRRRHNRYSNEYDESLQLYTKSEEHLTSNWQVRYEKYALKSRINSQKFFFHIFILFFKGTSLFQ